MTVLVLVVMLGVTAALSLGARSVHNSNERRLLRQRAREAAAVLSAALPNVQTPLSSAAEVAEATGADKARLTRLLTPLAGTGKQFASASIWTVGKETQPTVAVGGQPALTSKPPAAIRAFLTQAARTPQLTVIGLFDASPPRLAYAYTSPTRPVRYVIYAESVVPKTGNAKIQKDTAFSGLDFALYLGSKAQAKQLVTSSTNVLPLTGRQSAITVPFGNNKLHLVLQPTGELGGALLARLPWLLLAAGVFLALMAAGLTERLVRQRERAQVLADENASLYAAQRTVAQTLQHSMLPETLPETPGLSVGARYIAGVADIDIGGDWYDVIPLANGDVFFVVGDVSGRGLPAATIMASLRFAIRAYAAQGDDPASILTKLAELIDVGDRGHFATVLCGVINVERHEITLANAAHPEPLLIAGGSARYVSTHIGVPIGVRGPGPYGSVSITVAPETTLLAFTDGLVERRGEALDVGLDRLRETATRTNGSIDDLLLELTASLTPEGPSDDIAILGVRWKN